MSEATPDWAAAYAQHERQRVLGRTRVGCLLVILLIPAGSLIDLVYYKGMFDRAGVDFVPRLIEFFLARVTCSLAVIPIWVLTHREFGARRFSELSVLLAVLPAAVMAWIIMRTDGESSKYYAGLNLILLGVGIVADWNRTQSLVASILLFFLYLLAVSVNQAFPRVSELYLPDFDPARHRELAYLYNWDHESGSWIWHFKGEDLSTHCWFLVLTAGMVVIGCHISSRLRLSDFTLRMSLERSRNDVEQTNQRLEEAKARLEETNQKLRELDELKGRFFANISHELRTPLTLLLGPIERLSQHPVVLQEQRLKEYVGTMEENGLRLLKLINDLLDLVRLGARKLTLAKVRVDVATFTGGLLNSIRAFAEDRGLRVASQVDPELTYLLADPDKLEKVFLNLLFNSIKFTPAGGQVTLAARQDGEYAVFEVRDTGMGIAEENLANLFQRFWQADSSAQRKFQGAGIGLALVKELVEAHGGEVSASSKLGRGTTILVRLPIGVNGAVTETLPSAVAGERPTKAAGSDTDAAARETTVGPATVNGHGRGVTEDRAHGDGESAEAAVGEGDATPEPLETRRHLAALYRRAEMHASITPLRSVLRPWTPSRGGDRPVLLVVDDEPDMLRFLRSQLEEDYDVREAVDGEEATSMAAQYLPDAVVCDMMLPEKDGLQVCRELRANHTTRNLPFLMLTARADDETKLAALGAGASDFLPKPFSIAELKLRLKNLVDAQRLQRELARQNRILESTLEELRDTETQLVQAEKMASLGRLAAGIIHEINNPLNFARTGLMVLSRHGRQLPEEVRLEFDEVLGDIGEGIKRVSTIVGDLRQFSHPQAGGASEADLSAAVEASLRFLAPDWRDGKADIAIEIPDGFTVFMDRNKLVQVLLNMAQNAFDAMHEKPRPDVKPSLTFRAWCEGGRRWVSIRDNGPGIPDDRLPHIFEPFFTTKEVGKGMGLGLSICYRLIEEAKGKITVRSEVGRYCEFLLEFPDHLIITEPAVESGKTTAA